MLDESIDACWWSDNCIDSGEIVDRFATLASCCERYGSYKKLNWYKLLFTRAASVDYHSKGPSWEGEERWGHTVKKLR